MKTKTRQQLEKRCCFCGTKYRLRGSYHLFKKQILKYCGLDPMLARNPTETCSVCEKHREYYPPLSVTDVEKLHTGRHNKLFFYLTNAAYAEQVDTYYTDRDAQLQVQPECPICHKKLTTTNSWLSRIDDSKPATEDNRILFCTSKKCDDKARDWKLEHTASVLKPSELTLEIMFQEFPQLIWYGDHIIVFHLSGYDDPMPYYHRATELGEAFYFALSEKFLDSKHEYKVYTYCHVYSFAINDYIENARECLIESFDKIHSPMLDAELNQLYNKIGIRSDIGHSTFMRAYGGQIALRNMGTNTMNLKVYYRYFNYLGTIPYPIQDKSTLQAIYNKT